MTTSLEIPPAGVPSGTADVPVLDLDVLVVPDGTGYRTRVSLRTPRGEQTANRAFGGGVLVSDDFEDPPDVVNMGAGRCHGLQKAD